MEDFINIISDIWVLVSINFRPTGSQDILVLAYFIPCHRRQSTEDNAFLPRMASPQKRYW